MTIKRTLLLIFLIANCSKKQSVNYEEKLLLTPSTSHLEQKKVDFDFSLLKGVWWLDESSSSALLFISGDSLYYVEDQNSPFHIQIVRDTLKMIRDGQESIFLLKTLTKDSLRLFDPELNEEIILLRKVKSN